MSKQHTLQEMNQEQVKNIKFIDASQSKAVKHSIFSQHIMCVGVKS
jgi:hypothetical protein